jgi:hypothetical protein
LTPYSKFVCLYFPSSQDSLHKNAPQKKSKGIKSSLGRFFSKKDKQKSSSSKDSQMMMSSMDGGGAMSGFYSDSEMMCSSDTLSLAGGLCQKTDFDRRKKKK